MGYTVATENNWFTTNLKQRDTNPLVDFKITIKPYEFEDYGFYQNCNNLAKQLHEQNDKLYLCYSGGIDSEFVLKTFYDLGLPITPVIVKTPFTLREFDYAKKFCDERNIKYELISFGYECVGEMKKRTMDRGRFSLLGGIPLIICDYVSQTGGKLMTGYGDPFSIYPLVQPDNPISTTLEFSEWDYYLDSYDETHISSFFTYNLPVFYSLINQIRYDLPTQQSKYELYQVEPRVKIFPDKIFYEVFRSIPNSTGTYNQFIQKEELFLELEKYRINKWQK